VRIRNQTALRGQGRVDRRDVLPALADSAERVALAGMMSTTFDGLSRQATLPYCMFVGPSCSPPMLTRRYN